MLRTPSSEQSFASRTALGREPPVFDRSGKIVFLRLDQRGPINNWFTLENVDLHATQSIYLAVLRKDLPSPLVKESDEEKPGAESSEKGDSDEKAEKKEDKKDEPGKTDVKSDEKPKPPPKVEAVRIDFDGLNQRILDLPSPRPSSPTLQPGDSGQVFFLRTADEKTALQRFDLKDRKTETLLPDVEDFAISADAKKLVYKAKDSWAIAGTSGKKIDTSEAKTLKMDAIEVRSDPRAEWPEMFEDAWRINRDYFYDPGMHGLDWKAIHDRYAQFLPHLTVRQDLNRVIRWMLSELSVGHTQLHHELGDLRRGDGHGRPAGRGLQGRETAYRFAKVYGGLNWTPELRSPLTEPGVNVKKGDYLLAVGGKDVKPPANLYSFFENTSGKLIEITVGPNPDGKGSRTVSVVPIATELALRNRDWVEGNIRKVDAATGGRVAYVYVPNTANLGYTYLTRYFYPQAYKDAVILDERYNGGGSVADYYIDVLQKKLISYGRSATDPT